MACVFQNIDPQGPNPPLRPASVYPPTLLRGEDTLAGWGGGWGVNILEDARHSSVLYLYRILFAFLQGGLAVLAEKLKVSAGKDHSVVLKEESKRE
jgi:hypothetical protein